VEGHLARQTKTLLKYCSSAILLSRALRHSGIMPSKVAQEMPALLAAHVHALLVQTGLSKTAKKFESEFAGEVRHVCMLTPFRCPRKVHRSHKPHSDGRPSYPCSLLGQNMSKRAVSWRRAAEAHALARCPCAQSSLACSHPATSACFPLSAALFPAEVSC
jgi:hypothetical protein